MARRKDADKRQAILSEAKRSFALAGYESTSMGGLARSVGLPVGSIYTYFDSKEGLLESIIEEGWSEFLGRLRSGVDACGREMQPGAGLQDIRLAQLAYLLREALPSLFEDLDLIAILLSRAGKYSGLEAKLDYLSDFLSEIVIGCMDSSPTPANFEPKHFRTGLAVLLLGCLEAARLIHRQSLALGRDELIAFLAATVEGVLGRPLPESSPSSVPRPVLGSSPPASA
ncbi:MAG TPA: TetR/AcrR family transcriptional regulator [Rectinemataceae bacterium]